MFIKEHYKLPKFEEIVGRIGNVKVFARLDALKVFKQVELGEKSYVKTTFQTPFGRYSFLKMPYEIKTAPEVFHIMYIKIFKGI